MDIIKNEPYQNISISRIVYDAVLFDLDGVITQTATIHAKVWKKMFDRFLKEKQEKNFQPFDEQSDYNKYVDGKPRYDGVQSFLQSRGISLPWGKPEDAPGKETIYSLGNAKNNMFHDYLKTHKVKVFHSSVELIHKLKKAGFKTAIISSSKNCQAVLKSAGIAGLFDAKVDGVDSAQLNLKGKPHPDIFLKAAKKCNVEPKRAVVIEDAQAGVEAGKKGNFGCVIGVDRKGQPEDLRQKGADCLVNDLSRISISEEKKKKQSPIHTLSSALDKEKEIRKQLTGKKAAVLLDYDGTLTPIVSRPDLAILSDKMKKTVKGLAEKYFVAVVSGRDLKDVKKLVGLSNILYSGSHGFDIMSPKGKRMGFQKGKEFLSQLKEAEHMLKYMIDPIKGALVEKKKFSIAVHFRQVDEQDIPSVEKAVNQIISQYPRLRKSYGKKVFEIQPDLDWNKGKALLWILSSMRLDIPCVLPFYIGDDLTDEDAFQSLRGRGLGIVVGNGDRLTAADYRLNDSDAVRNFLERLKKE
ncbi:MAG: trehalose-phosphatase [Candidatus Aminicenantaceae bacterium]